MDEAGDGGRGRVARVQCQQQSTETAAEEQAAAEGQAAAAAVVRDGDGDGDGEYGTVGAAEDRNHQQREARQSALQLGIGDVDLGLLSTDRRHHDRPLDLSLASREQRRDADAASTLGAEGACIELANLRDVPGQAHQQEIIFHAVPGKVGATIPSFGREAALSASSCLPRATSSAAPVAATSETISLNVPSLSRLHPTDAPNVVPRDQVHAIVGAQERSGSVERTHQRQEDLFTSPCMGAVQASDQGLGRGTHGAPSATAKDDHDTAIVAKGIADPLHPLERVLTSQATLVDSAIPDPEPAMSMSKAHHSETVAASNQAMQNAAVVTIDHPGSLDDIPGSPTSPVAADHDNLLWSSDEDEEPTAVVTKGQNLDRNVRNRMGGQNGLSPRQPGSMRSVGRTPRSAERKHTRSWRQVVVIEEGELRARITLHSVSRLANLMYLLSVVCTAGIVGLLSRWFPDHWIRTFGKRVSDVDDSMLSGSSTAAHVANSTPLISNSMRIWARVKNTWGETTVVELRHEFFNGQASNVFLLASSEILYQLVFFEYRCVRYLWNPMQKMFATASDWKDPQWIGMPSPVLASAEEHVPVALVNAAVAQGLSLTVANERRQVFGPNIVDIPERSTLELAMSEVLHPFYIFQLFSIILWCLDFYYYYASCIAFLSILSTVDTLIETRKNLRRLREMSRFVCTVNVLRGGQWRKMASTDMVPGDVFEIALQDFNTMPCDALLLSGDCILNESMLTGESVPVSKESSKDVRLLNQIDFNDPQIPAKMTKSFLFNGTRLIRVRSSGPNGCMDSALGLVVRTGFNTTKGSLIRSMLFPKPHKFKFYRDSFRFIGVLACFALIGFFYSVYNFVREGASAHIILFRALDLITIIIPPALPMTMSIGTAFAIHRLQRANVFCISPNHVNVGGKVNVICFDKTGTLTEDGLDVLGLHLMQTGKFTELIATIEDVHEALPVHAMATCHQIKSLDGEHVGDPLDLKMFDWTGWQLEETVLSTSVKAPAPGMTEIGITKTFEFVSDLRRMSVITKQLDGGFRVFCKGAPEAIRGICNTKTLPADFEDRLTDLAHNGYRVIALATRDLRGLNLVKVEKMERAEAECEMTFLGFIVFENKLKPASKGALEALRAAKIRCLMCTGDNVLTAISVSRECGIVDRMDDIYVPRMLADGEALDPAISGELSVYNSVAALPPENRVVWEAFDDPRRKLDPVSFLPVPLDPSQPSTAAAAPFALAVTGSVFDYLVEHAPMEVVQRMLVKGQVFARMSPDQKQWLVEKLQEMQYCVSFCGDGANDCGALKAADVGLSLSEAEASVAAPFTSSSHDISCIIDLIKEGRAALVTSFSCFKYMALYSFIQFTSVTTLYLVASNLGDFQFLFVDIAVILPLAVTMGRSTAYHALVPKRPTANLLSKKVITSLAGNILLQATFQIYVYNNVKVQDFYHVIDVDPDKREIVCFENTVVFLLSTFQYIIVAICFTVGPPYRSSMLKNVGFIASSILLIGLGVFHTLYQSNKWAEDWLQLLEVRPYYQFKILGLAVLHFALLWSSEKYVYTRLSLVLSNWWRYLRLALARPRARLRLREKLAHKQKLYKRVQRSMDNQAVAAGYPGWPSR